MSSELSRRAYVRTPRKRSRPHSSQSDRAWLVIDSLGIIAAHSRNLATLLRWPALSSFRHTSVQKLFSDPFAIELTGSGEIIKTRVLSGLFKDGTSIDLIVTTEEEEATEKYAEEEEATEKYAGGGTTPFYRLYLEDYSKTRPLVRVNAKGMIVSCSRQVERVFGWPIKLLVGHSIARLLPIPYNHNLRFFQERPQEAHKFLLASNAQATHAQASGKERSRERDEKSPSDTELAGLLEYYRNSGEEGRVAPPRHGEGRNERAGQVARLLLARHRNGVVFPVNVLLRETGFGTWYAVFDTIQNVEVSLELAVQPGKKTQDRWQDSDEPALVIQHASCTLRLLAGLAEKDLIGENVQVLLPELSYARLTRCFASHLPEVPSVSHANNKQLQDDEDQRVKGGTAVLPSSHHKRRKSLTSSAQSTVVVTAPFALSPEKQRSQERQLQEKQPQEQQPREQQPQHEEQQSQQQELQEKQLQEQQPQKQEQQQQHSQPQQQQQQSQPQKQHPQEQQQPQQPQQLQQPQESQPHEQKQQQQPQSVRLLAREEVDDRVFLRTLCRHADGSQFYVELALERVLRPSQQAQQQTQQQSQQQAKQPVPVERFLCTLSRDANRVDFDWLGKERVGPYQLRKLIAEGGCATVWLADHQATGQKVAIKVFRRAELLQDPAMARMLEQEIACMIALGRPPKCTECRSRELKAKLLQYSATKPNRRRLQVKFQTDSPSKPSPLSAPTPSPPSATPVRSPREKTPQIRRRRNSIGHVPTLTSDASTSPSPSPDVERVLPPGRRSRPHSPLKQAQSSPRRSPAQSSPRRSPAKRLTGAFNFSMSPFKKPGKANPPNMRRRSSLPSALSLSPNPNIDKHNLSNNAKQLTPQQQRVLQRRRASATLTKHILLNHPAQPPRRTTSTEATSTEATSSNAASASAARSSLPASLDAVDNFALHSNILPLLGVIDQPDYTFLVLALAGKNLQSHVLWEDGLGEKEARHYMLQIVRALRHMHNRHFIHRDLKLENVLFATPEGESAPLAQRNVKLIDFGTAGEWDPHASPDTVSLKTDYCGTPRYAAPEMLESRPYVGPEPDMYSLGVMLYVMLTNDMYEDLIARRGESKEIFMEAIEHAGVRSPSLRELLYRLLDLQASSRMTLEELEVHPWLACEPQ